MFQDKVSFREMSEGTTRRTAAAAFMELLQLKTWGLLELDQREPFADISVMATVRRCYVFVIFVLCLFLTSFFFTG